MDYPTDLPLSAVAVQIFEEGMSPQYDITWSFTYELSNYTSGDEIGYCMFLQDASFPLSGGGVGPDLGFSGNTLLSAALSSQPLNKPILGVGFDSLGVFASDLVYANGPTRPGKGYEPNSITIRDKNLDIITTQAISAFDLISSGKKTVRARLGNYGRKVVVDYKAESDTFYKHLLTQELSGIDVYSNTRYRPGVSFVKPLISSNTNGTIVTTGFHVEGNQTETEEDTFTFTPLTAFAIENATSGPVPQKPPISEDRPKLPFLGMEPNLGCPDNTCDLPTLGTSYTGVFETSILYGMSAFIGDIDLKWSTPLYPYRFVYTYDDIIRLDTGFVGNETWNYGGALRSRFTSELQDSLNYANYPPIDLAPDGYPYVVSTLTTGTSSIYKDTDTSRLKTTVYSPLSTTDWEVFVGCPFYTLSCGITDQYLCEVSRRFEQLRRVILSPINPFPECSITSTPSPSVQPSITPSITPTPSVTPSITPSITTTPSITVTPSVTYTPGSSVTPTPSITSSVQPTVTPSITPSVNPSITPSITYTPGASPTHSATLSITPSVTYTTGASPTPSFTPSITPSVQPSVTPAITSSVQSTVTPSITPSVQPTVTPSITPSVQPSVTPLPSPPISPSVQPSVTPVITSSVQPTVTPSITPSVQPTVTPTPSVEPTISPSTSPIPSIPANVSVTPSVQPTVTPSITPSVTSTVQPTVTPSLTPTSSVQPTVTPSTTSPALTPVATPSVTPSTTPVPTPPAS